MARCMIIVPARLNSGRLKNKALLSAGGDPLVVHTLRRACQAADLIDAQVHIVTDSYRIATVVRKKTDVPVFVSKTAAWCGTARASNYVRATWRRFKHNFDTVINWQVDEPLVEAEDIRRLYHGMFEHPYDIATLVAPIESEHKEDENVVKVHVAGGECIDFHRFHHMPGFSTHSHCGVYAFRPSTLTVVGQLEQTTRSLKRRLEQVTWRDHGYAISAIEIDALPIGVNTPEDWERFKEYVT